MTFKVLVDDNFHYMDESERYDLGEFFTLEDAVSAAQSIVDEYLTSAYHPGMTAEALLKSYMSFGEDPFIIKSDGEKDSFSARHYAWQRCHELCLSLTDPPKH